MMNNAIRRKVGVLAVSFFLLGSKCQSRQDSFDKNIGKRAMVFTEELISFGPRPPQSEALGKVKQWLQTRAADLGLASKIQDFTAKTPLGQIKMSNVLVTIPAKQNNASQVVIVAHYDSKKFENFTFVGANDAASSVGLLLALAENIPKETLPFEVVFVFVDGEEALVEWSRSDSLYGSRHFVQSLSDKTKIKAAIVVDMVGDSDLKLIHSATSDQKLADMFEQALKAKNEESYLDHKSTSVEDDHTPFVEAGIPTLHLMDFTYGGAETPGTYWHTYADTMEHISDASLTIVGHGILGVLEKLAQP